MVQQQYMQLHMSYGCIWSCTYPTDSDIRTYVRTQLYVLVSDKHSVLGVYIKACLRSTIVVYHYIAL